MRVSVSNTSIASGRRHDFCWRAARAVSGGLGYTRTAIANDVGSGCDIRRLKQLLKLRIVPPFCSEFSHEISVEFFEQVSIRKYKCPDEIEIGVHVSPDTGCTGK